jgi:hypothetical protein
LRKRKERVSKTSAIIVIVLLFLLIGYSTYSFFKGNFERGFLPFPLLAVCYVFIVSRRGGHFEDDSDSDEAEKD